MASGVVRGYDKPQPVEARSSVTALDDPRIDALWIETGRRCGFQVLRGSAAYASTDGQGRILIGEPASLDPEDSLAQLVLHEICHALVQGEARWGERDWGLDNTSDRDAVREKACLRLQAHLAGGAGLRPAMAPTTEWGAYYEALPLRAIAPPASDQQPPTGADPDADPDGPLACGLARAGLALAKRAGWLVHLQAALVETAVLMTPRHPLGFAMGPRGESCGTCAWGYVGGRGIGVLRCRQSAGEVGDGRRVQSDAPACDRWEPPVDCATCGACCREAYHAVNVSMRDPVTWKHPGLIVRNGHRYTLLRAAERCAALEGGPGAVGEPGAPYTCRIYEDRPRTCRDFERGGRHCLVARRRVGLSRV